MATTALAVVLSALLLARWAAAQQFQLLGRTVVDDDFFVKGELRLGETLNQFIRRYRKERGGFRRGPASRPGSPQVTSARLTASPEPLGLAAGASHVLHRIDTSFSCEGLPYGYYSDPSNDCHVYHVCQPQPFQIRGSTRSPFRVMTSASFFCNVNQVFDQHLLTCVTETVDFDCAGVQRRYASSNSQFFLSVNFNALVAPDAGPSADAGTPSAPSASADLGRTSGERRFVDLVKRSFVARGSS